MIIISTQAFPPDSGGKQALMEGLASAASTLSPVTVLADRPRVKTKDHLTLDTPYAVEWFGNIKAIRQWVKAARVARYVNDNAVTHIFCDSWRSVERLPSGLPCSVIAYAHGNEYPRAQTSGNYPKQSRIRKALSKASHVIAVSKDTAERVTPFLPSGLTPTIIHPPITPAETADDSNHTFAKNIWPNGSTRLLALCRLIELKGVDQAIRALGQLKDKGTPAQLVIAGSGPDRARLEALTAKLGLSGDVAFAGRVEGGAKSALYDSADIFLQPGRKVGPHYEGFGITYLEAALHGLPTVSGNAGGAPEATLDGQTGFVVDATQTENVTNALQALISDTKLYARMSAAAKAHGTAAQWPQQIQRILTLTDR